MLRNFGGKNVSGMRGAYERLLKMGYGFSIIASVPLIMANFQVQAMQGASSCLPPLPCFASCASCIATLARMHTFHALWRSP